MAFATLKTSQNVFLETYLRGTGRSISAAQAEALYGIQNIRARMTEMRQAGLRVRKQKNTEGRTAYSVSSRNRWGSRANVFAV